MTASKKMEDDIKKKKMEDDLKKNEKKMKTTKKKNGKRPKQKWKTNQSTKINLIGCDTIVNSPSYYNCCV
jgi:hypothetical protein